MIRVKSSRFESGSILVIQALQQIIMKIFIRSKAVSWYLFIALQYLNHQK